MYLVRSVFFSRGEHFSIELTYNFGVESYKIGDGFNAMGLRLPDLEGVVARAKEGGGEIVSGPEVRLCAGLSICVGVLFALLRMSPSWPCTTPILSLDKRTASEGSSKQGSVLSLVLFQFLMCRHLSAFSLLRVMAVFVFFRARRFPRA